MSTGGKERGERGTATSIMGGAKNCHRAACCRRVCMGHGFDCCLSMIAPLVVEERRRRLRRTVVCSGQHVHVRFRLRHDQTASTVGGRATKRATIATTTSGESSMTGIEG